jgi:hypothetical protein
MFTVWILERKPTEGKSRQYSVREDVNVEDTDTVVGERERKRNLSYGKRKMVIKHDEEMAQNKMKVDKLLGVRGTKGSVFKEKETQNHTIGRRIQSTVEFTLVGTSGAVTERCLYCRAPAVG